MNKPEHKHMTTRQAVTLRRIHQVTLGLVVFVILVCSGMVVTAAIDDARIRSQRASSIATVVDVGLLRTTVRYPDVEGTYHQPELGLKYPVGLVEGQRVRVDYQIGDPENVKVQGRSWTLALIPALTSMFALLVLLCGLWWLLTWSLTRFAGRLTRSQPTREVDRRS